MADVKGLLADPDFQKLDAATQKTVLGRVDSAFSGLSDSDFQSFVQRMQPASAPSLSSRLPKELGHIYTPPLSDSGFNSENGFGPGTFGKGLSEVIQPGHRMAGIHHILTGGGEMALPFAAPAIAAAPLAAAGTAAAGTAGSIAGKYGSEAMGASPEASDLIGDAGGILGGGLAQSPKIQAFSRGAARAVPEALPTSPYAALHGRSGLSGLLGWLAGHAIGHPYEGAALGTAAGIAPTAVRGGISAAADVPWLPKFLTAPPQMEQYNGPAETPGLSNVPAPAPPHSDIIDTNSLPFTKTGGPQGYTPPPLPGPEEMAARLAAQNTGVTAPPVDNTPTVEQIARSLGAKGKLTQSDLIAAQKVQDSLRVSAPPSFKPDIESKVIAPDVPAGPTSPGKFEATLKGHQSAKAQKIQNIHDYLTTAEHNYTPEGLVQMDQASPGKLSPAKEKFLQDAYDWSASQGRPVPKKAYTSLNLQETRPGYEGQGTLQDVLDLMQGKEINPMHMPLKDPFGWGK